MLRNRESMRRNSHGREGFFVSCLVALLTFSPDSSPADESAWAALREGGKVILMRHAHVDTREGMGRHEPGNCAAEVNLSRRGVDQAKRIGEAFRVRGIAVAQVLASPFCRNMDTGKLAFGRATAVRFLMPPGAVSGNQAALNNERALQAILEHAGPSNKVMITHDLNILEIALESVAPGEFVVLKPDGSDFKVMGKVRIDVQ